MVGIRERLSHAWNAFTGQDAGSGGNFGDYGYVSSYGGRPDRARLRVTNERSIISSIYTRLAIDVGQNEFRHVRLDDQNRYIEDLDSALNECLTLEANIDQGAGALRRDMAMSLFDKGVIAIVPVDTTLDPTKSGSFDVRSLRIGEVTQWYPKHVKVSVYKEEVGQRVEIILEKKFVAIIENPLYSVMNESNSTLQRLLRKLNILDQVDEQSGSGKLDIIIQLPYVIKSEARKQQAEQRRKDIEFQLKGSQYGIAYTDGTEKITQLNRPAENNLLGQIEYLTKLLYSQLGLTEEVMNGTADEATMLNYMNRTIIPIIDAINEGMNRTFLTKTARSQKQRILYFYDPFKLVPLSQIAEIADKLTRNKILTANEVRGIIGYKPANDKGADKLVNANMPTTPPAIAPADGQVPPPIQGTIERLPVKPDGTSPSSQNLKGASQNGT
jgi:hypothetical protein